MSNDNVHLLAGAYAVDALPAEERAFFERHLAACEACRRDVADYQATAAELGVGVSAAAPALLRDRIIDEVDRTTQLPPLLPSHRTWARRLTATAAAAVLLVAGFALGVVHTATTTPAPETVAQPQWLASARAVPLEAVGVSAQATLLFSPQQDQGLLIADGLPSLDPNRATYQLWVLRGDQPTPAGTFLPDRQGHTAAPIETSLYQADGVAVTVEPPGGTTAPTGDILLQGSLTETGSA